MARCGAVNVKAAQQAEAVGQAGGAVALAGAGTAGGAVAEFKKLRGPLP